MAGTGCCGGSPPGVLPLAGSETYAPYGSGTLKIWRGMV